MKKNTLVKRLIECVEKVGRLGQKGEQGGIYEFTIDSLLKEWERRYPKKKFTKYGYGSFQKFLRDECNANEVLPGVYELDTTQQDNTADSSRPTKSEPENTAARSTGEDRELRLQCDVLPIVQGLIGSDIASVENDYISLKTNELWKICKEKGKTVTPIEGFKEFLLQSCFAESSQAKQNELRFNRKKINDYLKSRGIGEESYMREHQPPSSMIRDAPELDESRIHVESEMAEEQSFEEQLHPEDRHKASLQPVKMESAMENAVERSGSSRKICQKSDGQGLQDDIDYKIPDSPKNRFIRVVVCMYDCCLEALRRLFRRIHPSWRNQSIDASSMERGKLNFSFPDEEKMFETGNIAQWDITLICKVLLDTKVASDKLATEEFSGIKDVIKRIREIKNKLMSHKANRELTASEYKQVMFQIESGLHKLGFPKQDLKSSLKDADMSEKNVYFEMYLEEMERSLFSKIDAGNKSLTETFGKGNQEVLSKVNAINLKIETLEDLVRGIQRKDVNQSEIPVHAAKLDRPNYDEWLKVKKKLNNFDTDSNQYILIVDKVAASNTDYMVSLGNIPWKLVFDLDPDSDIDGLRIRVDSLEETNRIIVTHTPSQLADPQIDFKRTHWVFVNGRNKDEDVDAPKTTYKDWRRSFKTPISRLIDNCCKKLDKRKPLFCIVLDLQNSSMEIGNDIVRDIDEKFSYSSFNLNFIFFASEFDLEEYPGSLYTPLSMKFLFIGINGQLGQATEAYRLPSHQDDLDIPLKRSKYLFLSEYLEILYKGCENIPQELPEKEVKKFENDHLKSFLKGNFISFESLHYGHDATRSLTSKLCNRIQKISSCQIVQICHSPGAGGSTIARRVLWQLHTDKPCAIVKMDYLNNNSSCTTEMIDSKFVANLSERIGEIANLCDDAPVILIDGNSRKVINLSDHLVRKLSADGFRAIILRVVHPHGNEKESDNYFPKKNDFMVQSILEEDQHDLNKFKSTYKDYLERFEMSQNPRIENLTRVFHFPMMAMLEEFEKLKGIVKESLDIVKEKEPVHYEVAILVAFIQIYANRETPASVVDSYFSKKNDARKEYKRLKLSSDLLSLMVSKKARSKEKWIGSKKHWSDGEEESEDEEEQQVFDFYTFQHPRVAHIVIEHSERNLDEMAIEFVEKYIEEDEYKDLLNGLFLYNIESQDDHFSRLMMKLKAGGRVFEEAARKTRDAVFYSHAARYFAIKQIPPNFEKAKQLIQDGLQIDNNASRDKRRGVWDAHGHILLKEMKAVKEKKIKTVEDLEEFAKKALQCFRKARTNPPMTFPNPLQGEVNVWSFCFEWVIKWKKANVEEAVKHIMNDDFFKGSVGDCFFLIDQIDAIVQSVPSLTSPAYTRKLANDSRLSLMQMFGRTRGTSRAASIQAVDLPRLLDKVFKNADEKEITRLRVSWMMNEAGEIHLSKNKEEICRLLEKLVNSYSAFDYARHLLNVSRVLGGSSYSLDNSLEISRRWKKQCPHDAFALFYEYMICFLQVLNGSEFEYRVPYKDALEACIKKCESNHRKFQKRYFIAKNEDSEKMSRLISQAQLDLLCKKESQNDPEKQKKSEADYAKSVLFECHGRIRLQKNTARGKEYPIIKLEQGKLDIGIERNLLGKAYTDFTPDSRVRFTVSFTLSGPRANNVRFEKSNVSKFDRQLSKNGKSSKTYC